MRDFWGTLVLGTWAWDESHFSLARLHSLGPLVPLTSARTVAMARTKQTARKSTGGKCPRKILTINDVKQDKPSHAPPTVAPQNEPQRNSRDFARNTMTNFVVHTLAHRNPLEMGDVRRQDMQSIQQSQMPASRNMNHRQPLTMAAVQQPPHSPSLNPPVVEQEHFSKDCDIFVNDRLVESCCDILFSAETRDYDYKEEVKADPFLLFEEDNVLDSDLLLNLSCAEKQEHFTAQVMLLKELEDCSKFTPVTANSRTTVKRAKQKSKNVRIFISSTFRDMMDEREIIIKKVMPKLRRLFQKRGVYITEIDLRWGITTEQSMKGSTIDICLSEVDHCRPFFICMLGERYGWSQPESGKKDQLLADTFEKASHNYPWIKQYGDRSITELEVRHAVLNDASGKGVFFLRDPDYAKEKGNAFQAASASQKLKQDSLKQEVLESTAQTILYSRPEEIENKVYQALLQWLDEEYPLSEAMTPLDIERATHEAFQESRARIYVGGEEYLATLRTHASTFLETIPMVVCGESGGGKSALISNFVHQYTSQRAEVFTVAHYIGSTAASAELPKLLRRIIEEIAAQYSLDTANLPTDAKGLSECFPQWLARAGRQPGGMVLVLDALNQLNPNDSAHELRWLPNRMPAGVRLIVSTLPGRAYDVLAERNWKEIKVLPLSRANREVLIDTLMSQYSKSLSAGQRLAILNAPQCSSPLFLRTLLEELRVFGSFEELDRKLRWYLEAPSIPDLFNLIFIRLENDYGRDVIERSLALIGTSRRGISETELFTILKVPQSVWSPIYLALEQAIVSRSGMLTFSHDYIRQAVEARYIRGAKYQYHCQLAQGFQEIYANDHTNSRYIDETPFHLYSTSDWWQLIDVLSERNVFYTMYKNAKFDLFLYWRAASSSPSAANSLYHRLLDQLKELPDTDAVPHYSAAAKFFEEVAAFELAEQIYAEFIEVCRRCYGNESVHLATAMAKLGYLLRVSGRYTQAEPYYREALRIHRKSLKSTDPLLAQTINGLAILYRKMGNYANAEPLYRRALYIRKKVLGGVHEDVGQSYNSLGCLLQDQGKYEESEKYFLESIRVREICFGMEHPDVAMSLGNLASLYSNQSKYRDAEKLLLRAIDIEKTVFGEAHPDVADSLNSLAGVYLELAETDKALSLFQECLAIQRKVYGEDHPDVASTYNDMAVAYARINDYANAGPLYRKALQTRTRCLGEQHPDTAQSMNNLAAMLADSDPSSYGTAEDLFRRALSALSSTFGNNHPSIAQTYNHIANLAQRRGRSFDEVEQYYNKSLSILRSCYGNNHPDISLTLNDYALLCFTAGRFTRAEQLYKEAAAVDENVFGANPRHPNIIRSKKALADFYGEVAKLGWAPTE